jgi:PD-(D/E)XK nuclease superfamily
MKIAAWSYSRLNSFETCPKKFWHEAIAKDVEEPPDTDEQSYGNKVHKALELRIKDGKPLPSNLRHLTPIADKFANATGEKLTEQQLAIDASFRPVKWFDKNTWCRAIVDLAIVNKSHAVTVDYKTGNMSDDFTQQRLATSVLMLHRRDIETADSMYLWLKFRKITKEFMTRAAMRDTWNNLLPRVRRYQKAFDTSEFPARQNGLCKKYCPVKQCIYNGANFS